MLRSLGRKGVANRCQLPRNRHASMSVSPISTLRLYRRSIYQHPCFLSTRFLSTPSSTTSKSSKDEPSAHTILPPPPKTKVELRPGPIKPLTAPSGSHAEKVKQAQTKSPSSLQSPTAARSESIAETAREDLKQAYIHGVLARPPPDAGKIAKLWHQAKQIFKFYLRGL
jgi:LETM1 and EF-hand domain-containing protein 1